MPRSTPPPPTGIGLTALLTAGARVAENIRLDPLYRDHVAPLFLESAGPPDTWWPFPGREEDPLWHWLNGYIPLRTRFFDDCLLDAGRLGCHQVVVLGAGLDTRAFRLPWTCPAPGGEPGDRAATVYEIDLPSVLDFKEAVLAGRRGRPRCARAVVRADLRGSWTSGLLAAGFRPDLPTAWLAEGLAAHLGPEENDRLMESVTRLSAPGSRFATEYWNSTTLRTWSEAMEGAPSMDFLRHHLRPGCRGEPEEWFAAHGWQADVHALTELAHTHLRPRALAGGPRTSAAARAMNRALVVAAA
ncbi:SAM-dependent methyltransferase [Streptomyces amakusaensis]|uniref:S-adenosyl-L-methionine-dependent methyltransferase n=1 Tax=Streptomyces amakusaensis TaxID=67271 RepID=A0ABW0AQK5_9ACTN